MHLPKLTNKKISLYLVLLVLALVIVGIGMPHAANASLEDILSPISWIGFAAQAVAFIVQQVLIVLLFIESYIIDNLFIFNIVLNPTNMPAVIGGWRVLRDIANSLFLLILLWIAIKIIWGFDDGANKKLLVRLIIVAFLINFSLAITGAMFGFGNALAKPFKDKMGNDVAGFIVGATKLNTVTNRPADPPTVPPAKECLLSALTKDSSGKSLVDFRIDCPDVDDATKVMNFISGAAGKLTGTVTQNKQMKFAVEIIIADIFLILTIITFGGVAGFLIVRIAMMAFLGVLSPAAFFLYAVPGGQSLFDRWRRNVIGWSFIAPTFYFLFYVSLLVLQAMTSSPLTAVSDKIPFAANIFAMMPLVIFLLFLWATMSICKKLGAEVADAAIGMGKMAAGLALTGAAAVATGGLGLAAGAAARGVAKPLATGMGKLADVPVLGKLATPLTNPIRSYYQNRNQEITKMKGDYQNVSTRDLVGKFKTTLSSDKRVAMAEMLHQRGDFDKLDEGTQKKVLGYSSQFGREELLTARPDLANAKNVFGAGSDDDARRKTLNKMTPDQKRKMSKNAYADDEMKKVFLETAHTDDIKAMMKHNAEMTGEMIFKFFDNMSTQSKDALRNVMKPETFKFINSNMMLQTRRQQYNQQNPPPPAAPTPAASNPY